MTPLRHLAALFASVTRGRTSDRLVAMALIATLTFGVVAVLYVIVSAAGNGGGESDGTGGAAFLAKFERIEPPKATPDAPFVDPDGNRVSFKDLAGRVVLVNLWATWCAPCELEMPSLDRLQAQLGGDDFEVVVISVDRVGLAKSAQALEEWGIRNLATYNDKTFAVAQALGVPGLPTTILLNEEGYEVGRYAGPAEWDSAEAIALIKTYLPAD